MTGSNSILELARSTYCLKYKDNRLSLDHGSKKFDTIILFLLPLNLKMAWLLWVHTFLRLSLAENIFLSYVIIMIGLLSSHLTVQSFGYSLITIIPSSKNSTKYDKRDFILLKNISWYSIISLHSYLSKNTPYCTFFHLYCKWLSDISAVFEWIPVCQSISLLSRTVLPAKIDCSSTSGIFSSSFASSGWFAYRYLFTNWAKEYEAISNILLTMLIGKH